MMIWYKKAVAIALVAVAPMLAKAQAQTAAEAPAPFVPYNGASEQVNDPLSLATRPSEIRVLATKSETQLGAGLQADKAIKLSDALKLGVSLKANYTAGGPGAIAGDGFAGAGIEMKSNVGSFGAGARVAATENRGNAKLGAASFEARYVNPAFLRAGAEFTPSKKALVAAADGIWKNWAVSCTGGFAKGKPPAFGYGLERRMGKWKLGASLHPERGFFGGRMNPKISLRYDNPKATFVVGVQPQQKAATVGVGWKF